MSANAYILDVALNGALIHLYVTHSAEKRDNATGSNWDKPIESWFNDTPVHNGHLFKPVDIQYVDQIIELTVPIETIGYTPAIVEILSIAEVENINDHNTTFEQRLSLDACSKNDIKDRHIPMIVLLPATKETSYDIINLRTFKDQLNNPDAVVIHYGDTVENAINQLNERIGKVHIIDQQSL